MRAVPTSRLSKFVVVGIANTAVAMAVFNVLAVWVGLFAALSNVVAYAAGIANSYYWNRRWTFADRAVGSSTTTGVKFVLVNLVGLAFTTLVVLVMVPLAPEAIGGLSVSNTLWLNISEAMAILLGMVWNFAASTVWVFRDEREDPLSTVQR